MSPVRAAALLVALSLAIAGCEREDREFRDEPAPAQQKQTISLSSLYPGEPNPPTQRTTDYEQSAYNVAEGKRLYTWFNCAGCHFQGGGGIGVALMDDQWIYGSEPSNIFATIVEGRPNGMPAYRGKIPDQQVWQLVSYVRSLGGFLRKDIDSGRNDLDAGATVRTVPPQQHAGALVPAPVDGGPIVGSVAAHRRFNFDETSWSPGLLPALIAVPSGPRVQSVLDPVGPGASAIEQLWWLFFWVCAVVFLIVMLALALALLRGRATRDWGDEPDPRPAPDSERRLNITVTAAVLTTAVIVFALTIFSYRTDKASAALATHENKLEIEVTGRQWWWEARYTDQNPSRIFTTANEIHIPVGRTVQVRLFATDVIHSFWVPNLQGKRDLIPGQVNYLYLRADEPGVYRGQCAEFCGYQHAKMAFVVVAEPEDAFTVWRDAQIAPAAEPDTDEERQGHDVFVKGPCAMCHAIRGTPAGGRTGPDLTHLASRKTIAAGTLPNTRGHLAAWISDPQGIKPGSKMPSMGLPPPDLQALLSYLESLR